MAVRNPIFAIIIAAFQGPFLALKTVTNPLVYCWPETTKSQKFLVSLGHVPF